MNKEIREMAEIVLKASERFYGTNCSKECADNEAIDLYNAGYRKQSDTIKEFADKIIADLEKAKELNREKGKKAGGRSNLEMYNYCLGKIHACHGIIDLINELKKEYGVE